MTRFFTVLENGRIVEWWHVGVGESRSVTMVIVVAASLIVSSIIAIIMALSKVCNYWNRCQDAFFTLQKHLKIHQLVIEFVESNW